MAGTGWGNCPEEASRRIALGTTRAEGRGRVLGRDQDLAMEVRAMEVLEKEQDSLASLYMLMEGETALGPDMLKIRNPPIRRKREKKDTKVR